jgi:ribosomal protein S9
MIEWGGLSSPRLKEATKGMTAEETMAQYSQQLERSKEIIDRFEGMRGALTVANEGLARSQQDIKAALDRWANVGWVNDLKRFGGLAAIAANKNSLFPGRFQPIRDAIIALEEAINKFNAPGAKPGTEDLEKLQAAYKLYLDAVRPKAASKAALDEFMKLAEGAVAAAQRVDAMQKGVKEMAKPAAEATEDRAAIQEALRAVEEGARRAQGSAEGAKTETKGAHQALTEVSQINLGGLVGQAEALADAMWSVAMASQSVAAPAPAPVLTAAHGGIAWKFLASGGPAGTDVIPAMLSPGEVVINAASARKFAAQLTAINAGVHPVYRSEGGSVTNIGDINVTVNGGGTSRQTARSIAAELRRELRRGTATL